MAEHQTHAINVTLEAAPWRPCLSPSWRCAMAPRSSPASVALTVSRRPEPAGGGRDAVQA